MRSAVLGAKKISRCTGGCDPVAGHCFATVLGGKKRSLYSVGAGRLEHQVRPLVNHLEDEIGEEGVGPSEPRPGKICEVVLAERLVHQARASGRIHQRFEHARDFRIGDSRPASCRQCHRPDMPEADMRAADPGRCRALSRQSKLRGKKPADIQTAKSGVWLTLDHHGFVSERIALRVRR
jgi:hypothetical protein